MSADQGEFQFTDDRPRGSAETLVVRVPSGLNRKRRLLAALAGQLRFPAYFGWNWDALEECLRDLSWLHGVQEVILVHRDLPFAASSDQRAIYLSILQDRLAWNHGPRLTAVFPPHCRQTILNSLNQSNREQEEDKGK